MRHGTGKFGGKQFDVNRQKQAQKDNFLNVKGKKEMDIFERHALDSLKIVIF